MSDQATIISEALLFASMQFAIGSVEMSSKFSIKNFAKDQSTLQNAADALGEYMTIALLWTFLVVAFLFYYHGLKGAGVGFFANFIIIVWIYYSYIKSINIAKKAHNLNDPTVKVFGIPL